MAQSLRFGWFTHKEQRQLAGFSMREPRLRFAGRRESWLGSLVVDLLTPSSKPGLTNELPHGLRMMNPKKKPGLLRALPYQPL
jgi:hypothetical protein